MALLALDELLCSLGAVTPALPPNTALNSLASYPPWFVVLCLTIVSAAAIWVLAKVLKWGLYLMITLILIAGAVATLWLLFHPHA